MTKATLELCSGFASFSHVARSEFGYDTTTIDNDPFFSPVVCTDILKWDYRGAFEPGHFDVIWASPPCTQYSNSKRSGVRNLALADSIVQRCLEIIRYFKPRLWCVENPFTGMLKHRPFVMSGLPSHRVDYCAYDPNLGMKKSTLIWTNHQSFVPRTCTGRGNCPSMVGRRHRCTCTGSYYDPKWKSTKGRSRELARVPHQLIRELLCGSENKHGRKVGE